MTEVTETFSPEETFELGRRIAGSALPGQIFCLEGDLGAGKTVFAQGFGAGLGIREPINSPTFTILQVYEEGRLPMYHFDLYRLEEPEELEEIGYEEYFFGKGVCLIEWPVRAREYIPEDAVVICSERDPARGFSYRKITITGKTEDKK